MSLQFISSNEIGFSSGVLAKEFERINSAFYRQGINIEPCNIQLAKRYCDKVSMGNIDEVPITLFEEDADKNCWIFADTLGYISGPWHILREIKQSILGSA